MKSFEQKIVSLSVCILTVLMGMILFPTNSLAEDPETILEGEVTSNGNPAQNIEVIITNLETSDEGTIETDENGYYSFKFEDYDWEVNEDTIVQVLVEDPNREDPYFDRRVIVETPDEDKTYTGNFELEDITGFIFPTDKSGLTGTPYLGYVYVSKNPTQGGTSVTYNQNNMDYFARATIVGEQYTATFDTRFKDPRNLPQESYRERYYVMTKKDGSASSSSNTDQWYTFNPPHDTTIENIGVQHSLTGNSANSWIKCYSEGGYNVQYYRADIPKWTYGGSGWAGTNHYVWVP